ncbi:amino-acid N-acetyltransferase [gamma proteobacterium HTCC5015]|nr:amino-acid N-acetyltransferase [gamma proteobacterium HTCC5015]
MSEVINNPVQWFRDAAPYIQAHRGRTVVLSFGGESLDEPGFPSLLQDIALLHSLGLKLVLVHGVRQQLQEALDATGHKSDYHQGLRITDHHALSTAQQVVGSARVHIESLLSTRSSQTSIHSAPLRVTSGNFVTARPVGIIDGIDHLHTGRVRKIDTSAIRQQLDAGNIVLLSSLGYSPSGEVFNLTAEDVAVSAAAALGADKLMFLMECAALSHQQDGQLIDQLNAKQAQLLLQNHGLEEEVHTHLKSAIQACEQGVARTHLISRRNDGDLLRELYTRDGAGCLVTNEIYEDMRSAKIDDVHGILDLIKPLEDAGVLAYRSREQLELEVERFTVIERDGKIIGCVALYPYADEATGELACIAVDPHYAQDGRGNALLHQVEQDAKTLGLNNLFVLTTQTAHWFTERGFEQSDIEQLPVAKRALYNFQRNSKIFIKRL